jgi:DNA-binding transcriptional ArsR family regulator
MDSLTRSFTALSDPTRRAILERLVDGSATFTELARPFSMTKPAVVKHLRALESAGMIARDGTRARPIYRIEPGGLAAPLGWIERHARLWQESLDHLDTYVRTITEAEGGKA